MNSERIVVEFTEQTLEAGESAKAPLETLQSSLDAKAVELDVRGLPDNPPNALAWWLVAWYGVRVVARFIADNDDTWNAVTTFIADVMDGHLKDGWVKIEVAADGTVTHSTHKGNEHPEGSIVTVKDGKEEVRQSDAAQFTREHFLKALREVLKNLLS